MKTAVAATLCALLGAAALSAGTASGAAEMFWAPAPLPDSAGSVAFHDIATLGSGESAIVIAVGERNGVPAIYRCPGRLCAGDTNFVDAVAPLWVEDRLPAGATLGLTDLAVSSTGATSFAWAVGPAGVFRADGLASEASVGIAWTQVGPGVDPGLARSVALDGDEGLVGYANGTIRTIDATDATDGAVGDALQNGVETTTDEGAPQSNPIGFGPVGVSVNGLVMTSQSRGFAVTGQAATNSRVFELRPASTTTAGGAPAPARARALSQVTPVEALGTARDLAAVAADGNRMVAFEGGADPGFLEPDLGGLWARRTSGAFTGGMVGGVSVAERHSVAAGSAGGEGAVWWRTDNGSWTREMVVAGGVKAPHLDGVETAGPNDTWAVGNVGTVLHYGLRMPTPPSIISLDGPDETQDTRPTFTFSYVKDPGAPTDTGATFECRIDSGSFAGCGTAEQNSAGRSFSYRPSEDLPAGEHSFEVRALNLLGDIGPARKHAFKILAPLSQPILDLLPEIVVEQPVSTPKGKAKKRKSSACARITKSLLQDAKVQQKPRRLLIGFRLRVRAKVKVTVKRGDQTVGAVSWKTMGKGQRKLAVRYRGRRAPTRLRIKVKDARTCLNRKSD